VVVVGGDTLIQVRPLSIKARITGKGGVLDVGRQRRVAHVIRYVVRLHQRIAILVMAAPTQNGTSAICRRVLKYETMFCARTRLMSLLVTNGAVGYWA